MSIVSRKTPFILLVGDIVALIAALWLALLVRYGAIPQEALFRSHLNAFSYLFVIWIVVYFIAGLYERRAVLFRSSLPRNLITAQVVNVALAAIFFYFAPFIEIAPKTNLVVYLAVSFACVLLWRSIVYRLVIRERREEALIVGSGSEMTELMKEANGNPHYNIRFVSLVDLDEVSPEAAREEILKRVAEDRVSLVAIDFYDSKVSAILPTLYELLFAKVRFVDAHALYENVFGRVALSLLNHNWFLENISAYPKYVYDGLKRLTDFIVALLVGLASLLLYPFVYLAIKLDDGGPAFIVQERVGKDGKIIKLLKFRSMKTSDRGVWVKEHDDRITRVGKVLRKTRIDELPQLWSVVKGDLSLVGPRPDIYDLGVKLSKEIPYYTLRNVIKPGLSGWAQIRQDVVPQSLEETKARLAYDFFYIKRRSIGLDLKIILQTIATLASRVGK